VTSSDANDSARGDSAMAVFAKPPIQPAYLGKPPYLHTQKARREVGRALRVMCPREHHAGWQPPADRPDPIDLLITSGRGRLERLLPIRHGRMLASPFGFFRGATPVMASDLATTPSTGYAVQACGDSHLLNFGAFATPERQIIFDINDFDETFPAPWEWDLKRLAASFVIAGRANGHKAADCREAAKAVVRFYARRLSELAAMRAIDAWYSYLDYRDLIGLTEDAVLKRRREQVLEKALQRDSAAEFVRLGHMVEGKPRIKDAPPLVYHPDEEDDPEFRDVITANFSLYRESLPPERRVLFDRYELADVAMKVVGVGSVGCLCAIGLFFASEGDALFLQVKQVAPSVLEPYVGASPFASNGERVVFGQRLMQAASDIFLGWMTEPAGRHFYWRQLHDMKGSLEIDTVSPAGLELYAEACGWTLARAHARSGRRIAIAAYLGVGDRFDQAVADFAAVYADQAEKDHAAVVKAIRKGRIAAATGI
jgi:uncharacterized protein (DUF2252 family)